MKKRIKIGFSPCPNDTYIFDAMVNGRIDTGEFEFEPVLADVEQLNMWAANGELDVTKLSFNALGQLADQYSLLKAGSALGRGCGPLLISNSPLAKNEVNRESLVLIPGVKTTANFLLTFAMPQLKNKKSVVFDEIEKGLLEGAADLGLIIHENRFTYLEKGLHKVIDLGDYWEKETGCPIPLGGIAAKKSMSETDRVRVSQIIRESVNYANAQPEISHDYRKSHAVEMDEEIMRKHIKLYVNSFSIDLGQEGEKAIELFMKKGKELGFFKAESNLEIVG